MLRVKSGSTEIKVQDDRPFFKRDFVQAYKSVVLVLLATFFLSANSVIAKTITYMTTAEILFIKFSGLLVLDMPFLIATDSKGLFEKTSFPFLFGRGVLSVFSVYAQFLAFTFMPIAESSVITSTTPIWVMFLSRIFLKEHLDLLNTLSAVFSMIGLVLMSRVFMFIFSSPGEKYTEANYWYGCLFSLLSAKAKAVCFIFVRKLTTVHESIIIAYLSVSGVVGMAAMVLISQDVNLPLCGFDGVKVVLLGVFVLLDQVMVTIAMKLDKAGPVSTVRSSSYVIFMFVFQIALFAEIPDGYTISAALCVIVSLWLSGLRKYLQEKRRKKEVKRCVEEIEEAETDV